MIGGYLNQLTKKFSTHRFIGSYICYGISYRYYRNYDLKTKNYINFQFYGVLDTILFTKELLNYKGRSKRLRLMEWLERI